MANRGYIAFDLGAESGRAMLGVLSGGRVALHECHRFPNRPVTLPSGSHWDLTGLWQNLIEGLKKAVDTADAAGIEVVSLGVDTWGVDFGLIGRSGQLLGLPFAYRDASHAPAMDRVRQQAGDAALYDATGIQFMPFNTLFQLVARRDAEPALLEQADRLLTMPDLLHYFFSGQAVNEATIASTTQMIHPRSGTWHLDLLQSLHLPTHMLRAPVQAGTRIGAVRADVIAAAGLATGRIIDVIIPGSHDTASAVAAVPVSPDATDWAYLSSGTWSLMGAELSEPVISEATCAAGFTNERGVAGTIRFLKNISGLWLIQQLRADFAARGEALDYAALTRHAADAEPFRTLVDPDHPPFAAPGDMAAKFTAFAEATGQPAPQTPGQFVRAALESLALTYRRTRDNLDHLLGRTTTGLHIVGGGGRNQLLNQMTADALGLPVVVGPFEATAIGNALTQAIGAGDVNDLAELRTIVRQSFDPTTIHPENPTAWNQVLPRFENMLGK